MPAKVHRPFVPDPPAPPKAGRLIGLAVGGCLYYAAMRRLGAPRWAAVGFTDLAVRLALHG